MSLRMPDPMPRVLARRDEIVAALRAIVPGEGVIAHEREMRPYESDGLTAYRQLPMVVVLPETTEQVAAVLRYCHENGIKVVPRGAGTSLSGGALPLADGVLLGMGKFNRMREIDFAEPLSPWSSRASPISPSRRRSSTRASTTRPIRPRRSPAPSAATSRRIPAACIA